MSELILLKRRGGVLKQRRVVFFAVFPVLALLSFRLLRFHSGDARLA